MFPLLIGIERFGPIGVVELAAGVNRDHTTVSRQLAKLESLGLVMRVESADDRRTRRAVVTPEGKTMSRADRRRAGANVSLDFQRLGARGGVGVDAADGQVCCRDANGPGVVSGRDWG